MKLHIKFTSCRKIKDMIIPHVKKYWFDAIYFSDSDDEEATPVLAYITEDEDGLHRVSIIRMFYFSEETENEIDN